MTILKSIFYSLPTSVQMRIGWRLRSIRFPLQQLRQRHSTKVYDSLDSVGRKKWIFERVKDIAVYAQYNNDFYREYYKKNGFDAKSLKGYDDLKRIPIVNKQLLRSAGKKWNQGSAKAIHGNTGGTTGTPLAFSYDRKQLIKEDYFIGKIFARLNCSGKNTRLVFRGLSHLGKRSWLFHPDSGVFLINTYLPIETMKSDLLKLFREEKIEFLHGYPSTIYQFAKFCLLTENDELRTGVKKNLKGILFGSEYPAPVYRNTVDEAFRAPSISWYGHSEKVVLAAEHKTPFLYYPFQAYGWCEAIDMPDGISHLVGTDYTNRLSPFIRYDTSDGIKSESITDGILEAFRIEEARLGEFILDAYNSPVSLTALIFGRHHKIFEKADFVQISQDQPGRATLHVTAPNIEYSKIDDLFDLQNVNISFSLEFRSMPFKSALGKTPLLIPSEMLE